jgi:hypothetical protein
VRLRRLSHFLFEWPKRKATPLTRFAGVLPAKSAGGLRGLSTTHLVLTPNWLASCRPPCGLLLHPPAAAEGPRVEQRAFLRVLFRKARATARATLRFGFSPSAGQEGPLLYPGPLCGGETGTTGRAAGVDRDVDSFSPGQATAWMPELRQRRIGCPRPCRKARPRLTDLPGRRPGKRQAGCSFSLVTFSLSTQRESDSGAMGARTLCFKSTKRRARASSASGLLPCKVRGVDQPVFCSPCDTPLTQATKACSKASSVHPVARQRCSRSTCSRLIGST